MGRTQHGQQLIQIMSVNRPDIGKAQFLEQRPAHGHAFQHFLGPPRAFLKRFRQQADSPLGSRLQFLKRRTGIKTAQVRRQRPHWRRDAHLIVVQHHEQPLFQMTCVVQRLERHTSRHRAIADDSHAITHISTQIARSSKAQRRRN